MNITLIFVMSVVAQIAYSAVTDYCNNNTCSESTNIYYMTEKDNEYVVYIGKRATLRCCKPSKETIVTWYKNENIVKHERQYEITTFILRNHCTSEMIVSDSVSRFDTGNYTCVVTYINGSVVSATSVQLTANKKCEDYAEPESATWIRKPEDVYAQIGDTDVVISCSASIGFCEKRRSKSSVFWNYLLPTNCVMKNEETYKKGNGWMLSSSLIFPKINSEDFGIYNCVASIGEENGQISQIIALKEGVDPAALVIHRPSYTIAVALIFVFITLFVIAIFVSIHWWLEICLLLKDSFGKLEKDDEKKQDVIVIYDDHDAAFTFKLVKILEDNYQYKCYMYGRDALAGESHLDAVKAQICESRRFVMVLTPSAVANNWCINFLYMAIGEKLNFNSKIICILKGIATADIIMAPEVDKSGKTLGQILKVIKKVYWEPSEINKKSCVSLSKLLPKICQNITHNDKGNNLEKVDKYESDKGSDRFWKSFLLYLPPRREMRHSRKTTTVNV